jgi:hypothetical protein
VAERHTRRHPHPAGRLPEMVQDRQQQPENFSSALRRRQKLIRHLGEVIQRRAAW